ncbi:dipeptidase 2 isoform X3 [Gadus macrocephalus]|uniref:dipeptidase 2 isoform X3 n=1 Tax=Gadus macrocephalus TaxID=80720 RepID=UPI0028CBB091|nr:dipeptidase 2 isoform X3 [Gadus macrocephalus]
MGPVSMPSTICSSIFRLAMFSSVCGQLLGDSETDRVQDLMSRYPLIDGHNDLALQLRRHYHNLLSRVDLQHLPSVATDIARLRAGRVQTQVFAAYVLCGAQEKDAVRLTLEQLDVIRRMCTEYTDMELVTTAEGLRGAESRGKIACVLSIEGGHSLDSSLPTLRMFYLLGVRSMALTHNCNTPCSWETARAAISVSKAPVVFSHSSAYAICNHSRNVPDWLLHELKKNRGLIMVTLFSDFVACEGQANVSSVADHFDHIRNTIGAEFIGIGGDYEGVLRFPLGLEDVSKYPVLIQELLRRKWPEQEVAGVLRQNFLRVFDEVEKVRDELRLSPPGEAQIAPEAVEHPCRLVLRPPPSQAPSSAPSSGPPRLLSVALLLPASLLALH